MSLWFPGLRSFFPALCSIVFQLTFTTAFCEPESVLALCDRNHVRPESTAMWMAMMWNSWSSLCTSRLLPHSPLCTRANILQMGTLGSFKLKNNCSFSPVCMCMRTFVQVPTEAGSRCQIPWKWIAGDFELPVLCKKQCVALTAESFL